MKQNLKILLAEDDTMLASLLKYRIEKEGYLVTTTTNGKNVVEMLDQSLPDLLVADIMLPYFSGMELVDYLRNDLKSNTPIILISSASNDENLLNAFEIGANDFLSKPFSPAELVSRINKEMKTHYYSS